MKRKVLKRDKPPASVVMGYALLLASTPMTSATEIFSTSRLHTFESLGWSDQVVFTVFFALGMALLAYVPRPASTASRRENGSWVVPLCLVLAVVGVVVRGLAFFFENGAVLAVVGSALRGLGCSGLLAGWLELIVDIGSRRYRSAVILTSALLAASVLAAAVGAVGFMAGPLWTLPLLALFPMASAALLYRGRVVARRVGIKHLVNEAEANMPRATYVIIFSFGFALGCTWATFFSIRDADLALWASTAFLGLGLFMLVGVMTFMPKRDLEFGGAMRWTMFLSTVGFLLLPLIASVSPALVALLMALAWSAQVLLLSFLPVEIAVKLPVRTLSVASRGSVAYGVGTIVGSALAAAILFALPLAQAYSAITAVACICLVGVALRFPPLDTEASRMGMNIATRDERHAARVLDQSRNLAMRWKLTQREEEIAGLLLQGMTRQQVASHLNISEQTVKTHVKHIYEKLDVHSLRELALAAEKAS